MKQNFSSTHETSLLLTLLDNCDTEGFCALLPLVAVERVDLTAMAHIALDKSGGDAVLAVFGHPRIQRHPQFQSTVDNVGFTALKGYTGAFFQILPLVSQQATAQLLMFSALREDKPETKEIAALLEHMTVESAAEFLSSTAETVLDDGATRRNERRAHVLRSVRAALEHKVLTAATENCGVAKAKPKI